MSETATENATAAERNAKKGKAAKKPAKAKATTPKSNPAKPAKPKAAKAPRESREGWGTFALRLPIAERAAFHAAAGPAGASRFARAVLAAFANSDEFGFRNAIAEARKLQ